MTDKNILPNDSRHRVNGGRQGAGKEILMKAHEAVQGFWKRGWGMQFQMFYEY